MTRLVEGEVVRLRCGTCRAVTHQAVFSGESDMQTMDLISLASIAAPEVVVAEAVEGEFGRGSGEAGLSAQRRVSALLGRDDLRFVPFLRADQQGPTGETNFRAFMSAYQRPRLIYACPHCSGGEAVSEATQAFGSFEREGGRLTTVGDLTLST